MKQLFLFLSLALAVTSSFAQKPYKTIVEGTVVDRPYSKTLLLSRPDQDIRVQAPEEIPIQNGRFRFSLETLYPEARQLTFADEWEQGCWYPVVFFPGTGDRDTVRMVLYPMDNAAMNRVSGGPYNREMHFQDSVFTWETPVFRTLDSLQRARHKAGTFYSAEAAALLGRMDKEQNQTVNDSLLKVWFAMQDARRHMSPEATATDRRMRAYADSIENARYQYIRSHPSLPGYYWLYQQQLYNTDDTIRTLCEDIYRTVYAPLYPRHPYTAKLDTVFYRQARVGGKYADFTAPDLNGNSHRLSESVAGKIAVIDLWASWCGPCRRNSIALIPVYNEFKDKGFTVVGVARESDNADAMRKAIDKDGYTWLNLLELNDRAGIWQLYGIGNAGGSQFLIDRDGTILVVNPTAAEVRQILSEKLR